MSLFQELTNCTDHKEWYCKVMLNLDPAQSTKRIPYL